jgi:hypothetical protein
VPRSRPKHNCRPARDARRVERGDHECARADPAEAGRIRALDSENGVGAAQRFLARTDGGARRLIVGVGYRGGAPGPRLDSERGTERNELLDRFGSGGDAALAFDRFLEDRYLQVRGPLRQFEMITTTIIAVMKLRMVPHFIIQAKSE